MRRALPPPYRLQHVARVNKRLSGLCLAPQLLRSLQVTISDADGSKVVQRLEALLAFLAAHARHVRSLELDVHLPASASTEQDSEAAALVTACLTACAAAGGALEALYVSPDTPLGTTAWLTKLSNLQALERLGERPVQACRMQRTHRCCAPPALLRLPAVAVLLSGCTGWCVPRSAVCLCLLHESSLSWLLSAILQVPCTKNCSSPLSAS